jgi:hypothetical protein
MSTQTERQTIADFVKKYALTMTARDAGPAGSRWTAQHRKYTCTLRGDGAGAPMRVTFHMNPVASGRGPAVEDVLSSLALDASSIENARDFADWCADFGAEPDSETRRMYNACVKEARELRELLGEAVYNELLWQTESL